MADPVVTEAISIFAKVVAYVKAHATPTSIGTVAGFIVGKFGVIGAILKLL